MAASGVVLACCTRTSPHHAAKPHRRRGPLTHLLGVGAFLLGTAASATAQQATVVGAVTAEGGAAVAGATVQVLGTELRAVSDQVGRYTLRDVPVGPRRLQVRRIGFRPATVAVDLLPGETATVDFELTAVAYSLDAIVATATGNRRQRELGVRIETVDAAEVVRHAPVDNLQELLNARAAGISVLPATGTLGTGTRIRVRGQSSASLSNDPLIYLDGVRVDGANTGFSPGVFIGGASPSVFNDINIEDIESLEIVKGPSASTLFGTQAANGVMRITTRRGRVGPSEWNVFIEQGVRTDPSNYPDLSFRQGLPLDSAGNVQVSIDTVAGVEVVDTARVQCLPFQEVAGDCIGTDLFRRNLLADPATSPIKSGYRQLYGASVSGGTEAFRYYFSGTLDSETGTLTLPEAQRASILERRGTAELNDWELEPNRLRRAGLRSNLDVALGTNVNLAVSNSFLTGTIRFPQAGNQGNSVYAYGLAGTANPDAASPWPFGPDLSEPLSTRVERNTDRFINSASLDWAPIQWLVIRATAGFDLNLFTDEQFNFAGQGCSFCDDTVGVLLRNELRGATTYGDVSAVGEYRLASRWSGRTVAGVQYTRELLTGTLSQARDLIAGGRTLDAGAIRSSGEFSSESRTLGWYLEQTAGFDDRLFATGAVRVDGNSAFGSDNRFAAYPKASVSWVAREQDSGVLNRLRLRAALGASGIQPSPNAAVLAFESRTVTTAAGEQTGVTLTGAGNPTLKPERSVERELGVDVDLADYRATLSATYYHKRTTDAIVDRTLAPSIGATATRFENLGEVTNEGIEISVNASLIQSEALAWNVAVSFAGNRNRLVSVGEGSAPVRGDPLFTFIRHEPGYPLFGFWSRDLASFDDRDGNGIIDPSEVDSTEVMFLGSSIPVRSATFASDMTLLGGRIRIGSLLDYRGGFSRWDFDKFFCSFATQNCPALNEAPADDLELQARVMLSRGIVEGPFIQSADFVRWRELSLTLRLWDSWIAWFGAQTGSLTASVRNLATITGFGGWDPEVTSQVHDASPGSLFETGLPRTFSLRLNLGF